MRKNCPKRVKVKKDDKESNGNLVVAEDGYESSNVLLVATGITDKQWILDLGCSFHMSPNMDYFEVLQPIDEG